MKRSRLCDSHDADGDDPRDPMSQSPASPGDRGIASGHEVSAMSHAHDATDPMEIDSSEGPVAQEIGSSTSSSSASAALPIARSHVLNRTCACHFDVLATDEVRSIMQMLDCGSLLRLARCSKRMLSDADSDVAWRYVEPYEVTIGCAADIAPLADRLHSTSLFSRRSTSVRITRCCHSRSRVRPFTMDPSCIDAIIDVPRITKMSIECSLKGASWSRILITDATTNLADLTIGRTDDPLPLGFLSHLVQLPHLTRLDIVGRVDPSDDLSPLSRLASLSSLAFYDSYFSYDGWVAGLFLPYLNECRALTQLDVKYANGGHMEFRTIVEATNLKSKIRKLSIGPFWYSNKEYRQAGVQPMPAEAYVDAFQALTHLESLTLYDTTSVDVVLPHVVHLMSLVELRLMCAGDHRPSVAIIRELLLLPQTAGDRRHHQPQQQPQSTSDSNKARLNYRFKIVMVFDQYARRYHKSGGTLDEFMAIAESTPRLSIEIEHRPTM